MTRSRTKNNETMYISDAGKLLDRAFQGDHAAVVNLQASAQFMSPQQAMGLLQRIGHPAQGDVLATPNAGQGWESDRKDLITDFQNRSRQEPLQHLLGYLGELKKVPLDKQPGSAEFSELRRTIDGLSKDDARGLLPSFNFGPDPDFSPDAFSQLRKGLQDRAGERVTRSIGKPSKWKNFGDVGLKGKFSKPEPPSNDPVVKDAFSNTMVSSPSVPYGDGRTIFERTGYRNLPSLQVNKKIGRFTLKGKTVVDETGDRVFAGTTSSIDPTKTANANQAFNFGKQAQGNLIHANYSVEYEPKAVRLAGKEVLKPKFEVMFDSFVGTNGGVRAIRSFGQYPALQNPVSGFSGARAELQGKLNVEVLGRNFGEVKVKGYASDGVEAAGTISVGRVYDSIEGKVIPTGFELGGIAFTGTRAGLEFGVDIQGVGGKIKAETLGGIGLIGKIYAKSENGVLSFGGEHGAALGAGGGWSWGVSINPGKVVKAIPDKIGAAISAAPGAVGRKVAGGAKFVANAAAAQAQTAGKALHSAAVDMRDRAINGGRTVGTVAGNAWTAAGAKAQNLKQTAGKFSADLSRKIRSQGVATKPHDRAIAPHASGRSP